jgi:hypothetical protein
VFRCAVVVLIGAKEKAASHGRTLCRVENSPPHTTTDVHLWKLFISSANFDGLEWRKKQRGLKRNYMKPRWLAVSSRPRPKPTRSTVEIAANIAKLPELVRKA